MNPTRSFPFTQNGSIPDDTHSRMCVIFNEAIDAAEAFAANDPCCNNFDEALVCAQCLCGMSANNDLVKLDGIRREAKRLVKHWREVGIPRKGTEPAERRLIVSVKRENGGFGCFVVSSKERTLEEVNRMVDLAAPFVTAILSYHSEELADAQIDLIVDHSTKAKLSPSHYYN